MRLAALGFGVLLLTGCNDQAQELQPEVADLDRGKSLYERDCQLCHGLDGRGGALAAAVGGVPDLVSGTALTGEQIVEVILNGRGRMKGWSGMLDLGDALDIAGYLKSNPDPNTD